MMQKLNPNSKAQAAAEVKAVAARVANRATVLKQKRSKVGRKEKAVRTARFTGLADGLEEAFVAAHLIITDEIAPVKLRLPSLKKRKMTSDELALDACLPFYT